MRIVGHLFMFAVVWGAPESKSVHCILESILYPRSQVQPRFLSCWESVSVYCTLGSLTFLSSLFLFLALVDPLCETGADQAPEENHQSAQFCWVQW